MEECETHKAGELVVDKQRIELSVIAPCYNEEENVGPLARRLLAMFDKNGIEGEVVLVDDASRDGTVPAIRELTVSDARVRFAGHSENRGLFEAWRTGMKVARGAYVCFIDADLQNPPEEVVRLYRSIRRDAVDMVQGVRSSIGRLRDGRFMLSGGLNVLLNTLFSMTAADNKSGFVLASREVMEDVLDYREKYFYPHTFIRVSAERKGYSIGEVETLFVERVAGRSFLSHFPVRAVAAVLLDLAKALIEFRLQSREDELTRFMRNHPPQREPEPYRGWRRWMIEAYFLTMPLHKWMITRRTRNLFFALRRSQWLSAQDLEEYRRRKLHRLIRHAYNHVPLYRERFEALGIKPEDIKNLADLHKLPLLSKDDVRANLHFDLFADNHKKNEMLRIATSGSTGEPSTIYADRYQLEMRFATTMRAAEWTGWRFGDRQARLWHQTIGMTRLQVIREKIDAWFMRRLFVPAYELRDDNILDLIEKMRRWRPVLVDGYAESFNFLAAYAGAHGVQGWHPKAIVSSAQILPDQTRGMIEKTFGCRVFDKYGSREFSGIAYEDDGHDGHLVMAESYIVELLKDGRPARPGEIGEVVITDLNNLHVPIIRYRIGDLAVALDDAGPSSSGRQFPRIGRIEGRSQAIVFCPNGAWLPGTFFAHYFKDFEHIVRHYQVVQETHDALLIKVAPAIHYSPAAMERVLQGLRPFVGEAMRLECEIVAHIPMVRTGKRTGVISKLSLDFQALSKERRSPVARD